MHVKSYKGFLLLEACLSILLVGVFSCVMASWYIQLVRIETEIARRIQAVMLAQSLIEEFKAFGRLPTLKKKAGSAISWDIGPDPLITDFRHVAVTISRICDGRQKSFCLKTGILLPRLPLKGFVSPARVVP